MHDITLVGRGGMCLYVVQHSYPELLLVGGIHSVEVVNISEAPLSEVLTVVCIAQVCVCNAETYFSLVD